ncbi:hypothetical protein [Streptomyces zagrosensis]|uniref:Uncharacterized protein n=1 Tax=Streptomyces zagrosensis TaxID=1042984 RepID=A0A7W9QH07_9ACTN|nr:hypothetical protein [Streptomyces zagrosensis]MBB5939864.1 hypothetical protein [Streptomyces zagrosensis]
MTRIRKALIVLAFTSAAAAVAVIPAAANEHAGKATGAAGTLGTTSVLTIQDEHALSEPPR